MLAATLLFAFGRRLTRPSPAAISHQASNASLAGASAFELLVAIYGGYFGGGMGIMNLAMLSAIGMAEIHTMNALKVLLAAAINGVATIIFIVSGAVAWPQAVVMIVGAICGGYSAAHYAQKIPSRWIRALVIAIGLGMSVYFFWKAYRSSL